MSSTPDTASPRGEPADLAVPDPVDGWRFGRDEGLLFAEGADLADHGPVTLPTPDDCTDYAPAGFSGHWRDWHRGHGCRRDPDARKRPAAPAPPTRAIAAPGLDLPALKWRRDADGPGHAFRAKGIVADTYADNSWSIAFRGYADDEPSARARVEAIHATLRDAPGIIREQGEVIARLRALIADTADYLLSAKLTGRADKLRAELKETP